MQNYSITNKEIDVYDDLLPVIISCGHSLCSGCFKIQLYS